MAYTNLFEISKDFSLYVATRKGTAQDLSMFPAIARSRFTWIVNNWQTLYPKFKQFSAGDQQYESALSDFDRAVTAYKLGSKQNPLESTQNIVKFLPFLSLISMGELGLVPEEQQYVDTEVDRVGNFNISNLREMVKFIREQSAIAGSLIGAGDAQGTPLIGIQPSKPQRAATFDDFEQLQNVLDLQQLIEGTIFDLRQDESRPPDILSMDNAQILGGNVTLKTSYLSSYSLPFSVSLEDMAQRFLGDKTRWFELVTINGLMPPYVDEFGEKFMLITPGSSSSVTISDSRTLEIPIGQKIHIGSYRFKEETRIIERKLNNGDGTTTLFLSGAQNLNSLKPADAAFVRIYKPHTVNTGSMILIPVDTRSSQPTVITPTRDDLRRLDNALLSFGIDIKRDPKSNDFLLDSTGNFLLATGLDNVRQSIFYAVRTKRGELPFHTATYGVNLNIGDKFMGTADALQIFSDLLIGSLSSDTRFTTIKVSSLKSTGNGIAIDLLVGIAGNSSLIPLSFVS